MVKTKIDHAIFWCTVSSNTDRNLSLHVRSSWMCILQASITGEFHSQRALSDHQNYWPMEDLNHHRCCLKLSRSCEKKKLLLEGHFCVVFNGAVICWYDIITFTQT